MIKPLDRASAVTQFWNAHDEALFAQPVLAAITDLSPSYFERGRWGGFGPRFLKIGHAVRYRKADVVDWINQRPSAASTQAGRCDGADLEARAEALEQARCAYINLHNLVKMAPLIKGHPMVLLVRIQIRATIEALASEDGKRFCDHEDASL